MSEDNLEELKFDFMKCFENKDVFHPNYKYQLVTEKTMLSYSLRRPYDASIDGYIEASIDIMNHLSKMLKNAKDFEELKQELSSFVKERNQFARSSHPGLKYPFFWLSEDEIPIIKSKIKAKRLENKT